MIELTNEFKDYAGPGELRNYHVSRDFDGIGIISGTASVSDRKIDDTNKRPIDLAVSYAGKFYTLHSVMMQNRWPELESRLGDLRISCRLVCSPKPGQQHNSGEQLPMLVIEAAYSLVSEIEAEERRLRG